jgi:hypothetical protein
MRQTLTMVTVRTRFFFGVLLGVVTACDGGEDKTTFDNAGSVCFTSTATGSVKVNVSFPGCLSSSCDRTQNAQCRITEKDGVIKVASHGEVVRKDDECTDDCGSFTVQCASEPIAAGTYVVTYGEQTAELTLPATGEQRFGDSVFPACQ